MFLPCKVPFKWNTIEGNSVINAVHREVRKWATPLGISPFSGKTVRQFALLHFMTSLKLGKSNIGKYRQKKIRKCQANDAENSFSIQL